jgi:methylamine utilization protein MauE
MDFGDPILAVCNAIAASLLLNSGIAKTVATGPPRRAVEEIVPVLDGAVIGAALRVLAIVEIAVAAALPAPPVRMPAAAAVSLLGVSFVALGLLGIARHSETPCGCFGASGRRPLGWSNAALGLVLAAAYPINAAWSPADDYTVATLLLTSIMSIALCVYMRRELVIQLLKPRRGSPAESEAL